MEEEGGPVDGGEGHLYLKRKRQHCRVEVLLPTLSQVKREGSRARRKRGEFEVNWDLGDDGLDVAGRGWNKARARGNDSYDSSWEEDEGVSD